MQAVLANQIPAAAVGPVTKKDLLRLASVRDKAAHAISFYCTSEPVTAREHWQEVARTQQRIAGNAADALPLRERLPLSSRMMDFLQREEQARERSPRFQVAFECSSVGFYEEFAIHAPGSLCLFKTAEYFFILPLWHALQACSPYSVALVGKDEARCFLVTGVRIEELPTILPREDFSFHDDVPWTHHVEGNIREHEKHFLKSVASALSDILQARGDTPLVVGCREEVWSVLAPCLSKAGLAERVFGRFHLPNVTMPAAKIPEHSAPVILSHRQSVVAAIRAEMKEQPERWIVGTEEVLSALHSTRVQKLLMPASISQDVQECASCATCFLVEQKECPLCGDVLSKSNAGELLLRRALATDTEVLSLADLPGGADTPVSALLSY